MASLFITAQLKTYDIIGVADNILSADKVISEWLSVARIQACLLRIGIQQVLLMLLKKGRGGGGAHSHDVSITRIIKHYNACIHALYCVLKYKYMIKVAAACTFTMLHCTCQGIKATDEVVVATLLCTLIRGGS